MWWCEKAAGLLIQQYLSFCHLARVGVTGKRYIYQGKRGGVFCCCMYLCICFLCAFVVYRDLHYLESVHLEAQRSMQAAVAEVQALSHYA